MTKELKESEGQEMPDDLKQWFESIRQPFIRMLKNIYDDQFQKQFQKRLTWKDDMLWYEDPEQCHRYSVPELAREILSVQNYYGGLVGPRGGLDYRGKGKERKGLAILLLEWGYLLQENMDREAVEPLKQALERFLEDHRMENEDKKEVISRFMPVFADVMYRKRAWNSELLQNTDRMLLRKYLKPAFECLQRDQARPDGSVNACAGELLPVISVMTSGKTAEERQGLSRDAAVLKVLLQNLVHEYFHSAVEGSENSAVEPDGSELWRVRI